MWNPMYGLFPPSSPSDSASCSPSGDHATPAMSPHQSAPPGQCQIGRPPAAPEPTTETIELPFGKVIASEVRSTKSVSAAPAFVIAVSVVRTIRRRRAMGGILETVPTIQTGGRA